jgi:hypothetical protein
MQFKTKYLKISALAIVAASFMACGGSDKPAETPADSTATSSANNPPPSTVDDMVDFKFHYLIGNIPSPMELVDALPSAGFTFSKDLLNNIDNEKKYNTSFKKAVNFGVYSVDMAYIASNEEFTMVKSYMATAQSLAKSLELSETFNKVVGDRLKNNAENKDSLKKVIDHAYYEQLHAQQRKSTYRYPNAYRQLDRKSVHHPCPNQRCGSKRSKQSAIRKNIRTETSPRKPCESAQRIRQRKRICTYH